MKTIGEVIDALEASAVDCYWIDRVRMCIGEGMFARLRALAITEENMLAFSNAIAAQIRKYPWVPDYEATLTEGHALLRAIWQLVKSTGIPEEVVDIPISLVEIAEEGESVSVGGGLTWLT